MLNALLTCIYAAIQG